MELKHVIIQRTSIRSFTKEKVPLDDIKEMIRLAGYAPSINNYQPWQFTAIMNRELLQKMAEMVIEKILAIPSTSSRMADNIKSQIAWYSTFFEDAPVLLALAMKPYENLLVKGLELTDEEYNKIRNYPDIQGVGACIQNLLLTAVDLGYGACWLSGLLFAREELEKCLNISPPWSLVTFVAIGKSHEPPKPRNKRDLAEELIVFE